MSGFESQLIAIRMSIYWLTCINIKITCLFKNIFEGEVQGPNKSRSNLTIRSYEENFLQQCSLNYVYFYFLCFCQNVMEQLIIAHFIYNAILWIHPKGIFGPILSRNILFRKLVLALQQSWLRKKVVFVWKSWDKYVLKIYHHLLACQGRSIQLC